MNILRSMGIQTWRMRLTKEQLKAAPPGEPRSDLQAENTEEFHDVAQQTEPYQSGIQQSGIQQRDAERVDDLGSVHQRSDSSSSENQANLGGSRGGSESLLQAVDSLNKSDSSSADQAKKLKSKTEGQNEILSSTNEPPSVVPGALSSSVADAGDEPIEATKESSTNPSSVAHSSMPQLRPAPVPLDDDVPDLSMQPMEEVALQEEPVEHVQAMPSIADQIDDGPGWRELQKSISMDQDCPSCGSDKSILGQGDALASWMFVTSAPTNAEIEASTLLLGRQGALYEAILKACCMDRNEVYTTSVFKCAPPEDLSLQPTCNRLIHRQIELVGPRIIVVFGEFAAQSVLRTNDSMNRLSDRVHSYPGKSDISVIVAPSIEDLLTQPSLKASLWSVLKTLL